MSCNVMKVRAVDPIGVVGTSRKSTKVDIEILLAIAASKETRVTGSDM